MSSVPAGERDLDREILRRLSVDGRCSFTDLARETGLSVSAVHQRVRRLEQRGVLRDYRGPPRPRGRWACRSPRSSRSPRSTRPPRTTRPDRLAHLGAIEACHSVAGKESYILKVRVAGPMELEVLLQQIREAAQVSTRTTVVLSTPYEGRPPPL